MLMKMEMELKQPFSGYVHHNVIIDDNIYVFWEIEWSQKNNLEIIRQKCVKEYAEIRSLEKAKYVSFRSNVALFIVPRDWRALDVDPLKVNNGG